MKNLSKLSFIVILGIIMTSCSGAFVTFLDVLGTLGLIFYCCSSNYISDLIFLVIDIMTKRKKLTAKEQAFKDMGINQKIFNREDKDRRECDFENPGLKFGIRVLR